MLQKEVAEIIGVNELTITNWEIGRSKPMAAPNVADTLISSEENEILELDELLSFVYQKTNKRWLWIALCRRTRKAVSFFFGNRSEESCQQVWNLVPSNYKNGTTYSDFWPSYEKVIQTGRPFSVGKQTGQTAHVERWNNTLRQRIARYVGKTHSFSKSEINHFWFTRWFIVNYNLSLIV